MNKIILGLLFIVSISQAQVVKQNGNSLSGITGTLDVDNGGTGSTSLTQDGVLSGNGTSAVQVSTSVKSAANQLTIGNGTSISTITNTGQFQLSAGSTIAWNGTIALSTGPSVAGTQTANLFIDQNGRTYFSVPISSISISTPVAGDLTKTVLGECISSTVTINLPVAGDVEIGFIGQGSHGTLNGVFILGVWQDGGFGGGGSATVGVLDANESGAGNDMNMSFTLPLTGLSAGVHNLCLLGKVASGKWTWDSSVATNKFWVKRLP